MKPAEPPKTFALSSVLTMRRRSVWEAADSGILLWRKNFFYFIPLFALPIWIVASALMFIPVDSRWLSFFALWWLKPLFDRLALHVVAVRFFRNNAGDGAPQEPSYGSAADFRSLFKGMAGMIFRGLPGDLLWRRFSPHRSAAMPLRLLERPSAKQYAARKNALASGGLRFCTLLSLLGPFFELFLLGGEFIFALMILEFFSPGTFFNIVNGMTDTTLFVFAAYCFNYILVESLYVCMGFGIYINSRTEVEGWDIQLLFRKFTEKAGAAIKVILVIFGLLFFALPASADDPAESSTEENKNYFPDDFMPAEFIPLDELQEILASDDFGGYEPGWTIRQKNKEESKPLPQIEYRPWFDKLKEALAFGLRAIIVIIIAGFIVFAIIKFKYLRSSRISSWKAGFAVNPLIPAEDPQSCFKKAEDFFRRGMLREAWAECLCGSIGAYNLYLNIYFPPDATEYGCLEIVQSYYAAASISVNANSSGEFAELVKNWILLAYGGRNPPDGSFEKALLFGRNIKDHNTGVSHA